METTEVKLDTSCMDQCRVAIDFAAEWDKPRREALWAELEPALDAAVSVTANAGSFEVSFGPEVYEVLRRHGAM